MEKDVMSLKCNICGNPLSKPVFSSSGPSITSTRTFVDSETTVFLCSHCGHAQSPDLPDSAAFYSSQYRISLDTDDHDQIITVKGGKSIFRTDFQAQAVLDFCNLRTGASILDYGCAKATSLHKVCETRSDVSPYLFDVSDSYREFWRNWVPDGNTAVNILPDEWLGKFDLITLHFVIEHVSDPCRLLASLSPFLRCDGRIFVSVPDTLQNTGDLLVVDHVNHFTESTLCNLLIRSGYKLEFLEREEFPGALIAIATVGEDIWTDHLADITSLRAAAVAWSSVRSSVIDCAKLNSGRKAAIYGAGFYGSLIRAWLRDNDDVEFFIDQNPHLQGQVHLGLPILSIEEVPSKDLIIYAGLNPLKAKSILFHLTETHNWEIIWLEL